MKTRKQILVVMATLLLGVLLILPSPIIALAAHPPAVNLQVTVFGSTSDGHLHSCDHSYAATRTAPTGTVVDQLAFTVGQGETPEYCVRRAGLFFDTSVLPDHPILSARLSLFYLGGTPWEEFDVTVVNGAALDDPLVPADYGDLLASTTSGGSIKTRYFADEIEKRIEIPINGTGLSWIDTSGMTKLALRSSKDIGGNTPSNDNDVTFYSADHAEAFPGAETYPRLIVTFPEPPPCPECPEPQVIDGGKTVGGTLQPVNKLGLLLPYVIGVIVLLVLVGYLVRRRVRG